MTFDTTWPNGILVSQDQHTLYVAESGYTKGINRELRAYPIREDGGLGGYTTLYTWGDDAHGVHRGMCLDAKGNIVAAAGWEVAGAGPMIYVISPAGLVSVVIFLLGFAFAFYNIIGGVLTMIFVVIVGAVGRAKKTVMTCPQCGKHRTVLGVT